MLRNFVVAVVILSSFSGCLKSTPNETCNPNYDPCNIKAPASEIQAVQNYLTANGLTATQHCSGMFYTIDNPGTGATANVCSDISVTYEGKLTNGNVFETKSTPIALNLSSVILGWKNGIPLIKEGGRIYLYIPPTLGYGSSSSASIPANSILIFRVELVSVH
ncbi:MAG: FKBP-type peptidyl-prolyl cis-trans isomerase [Flavisolibacter sp.]